MKSDIMITNMTTPRKAKRPLKPVAVPLIKVYPKYEYDWKELTSRSQYGYDWPSISNDYVVNKFLLSRVVKGNTKNSATSSATHCKEVFANRLANRGNGLLSMDVGMMITKSKFSIQNIESLVHYFEDLFMFTSRTKFYSVPGNEHAFMAKPCEEWSKTQLSSNILALILRTGSYYENNFSEWLKGKIGLPDDKTHIKQAAATLRDIIINRKIHCWPNAVKSDYHQHLVNFTKIVHAKISKRMSLNAAGYANVIGLKQIDSNGYLVGTITGGYILPSKSGVEQIFLEIDTISSEEQDSDFDDED